MTPYFKVDITSAEEEQQQAAKFLKILNSLGEHASSYLFQKGVVLGDDSFSNYDQQLSDTKFRDSIINVLLRNSDKDTDKDTLCQVAVLLFNMSKEAAQVFSDITAQPAKTGASSGIIALGHLMALIDRATAFLNLPSVNDKAYWRLVTLQPPAPPQARPAPVMRKQEITQPPEITPAPELMKAFPASAMQFSSPAPKPVMPPPAPIKKSPPIPILSPKAPPPPKVQLKSPPELKAKVSVPANKSTSAFASAPKDKALKNTAPNDRKKTPPKTEKGTPPKQAEPAVDTNKPEGPIKAMLRRIAEEIQDNSYEAILEAIKDSTLMKDLYNTPDNPISVKVTEVNTKERVVYLIKQKRGAPEPVTFRLIRKLITELQL